MKVINAILLGITIIVVGFLVLNGVLHLISYFTPKREDELTPEEIQRRETEQRTNLNPNANPPPRLPAPGF